MKRGCQGGTYAPSFDVTSGAAKTLCNLLKLFMAIYRGPSKKLQIVKKFLTKYGKKNFINIFYFAKEVA